MSTPSHPPPKLALAYANLIVRRPLAVLLTLVALGVASGFATFQLRINSNQLDLISQDLPEVKDVKRVIDMVGGAGYLIFALRSDDEKTMKGVVEDMATLLQSDKQNVRFITYKLPVEFIQQNMVLFVKTEDLREVKKRVSAYLKDQLRRNNPFFVEIRKTEPVKLELTDIIDHYSHVGSKSILDDYNISDDKKMMLVLIKPMWDSNELGKTKEYLEHTLKPALAKYSEKNAYGVKLEEAYNAKDYEKAVGHGKTITYGFTGSYKLAVDDSYAIENSLGPVTWIAFIGIALITIVFFRRVVPTLIVLTGMALGTLITLGFTWATIGTLNMVTSMLGGILMGFGVDYGIHFIFRTRLELGAGKSYEVAIRDALINAGRPALVAAVVTAGSFFVLIASQFRGFSQFGFLAGCGTFIIGFTLFAWSPALLSLIGQRWPELPAKLIGTMKPPPTMNTSGQEIRIPNPVRMFVICVAVVGAICLFAVPKGSEWPTKHTPSLSERFLAGISFNYNTRALMPEDQHSVTLMDEIGKRFRMSSDPIAVYTKDLEGAKEVYDELTDPANKEKYSTVSQVISIYSFVPPKETAEANAKILADWKEELKEIDPSALPPQMQDKATLFKKILEVRPFDVHGVPEIYASQFRHLATTRPENHGYLTFIYPGVDLWEGKRMIEFTHQTYEIKTRSGNVYHAAGQPVLYAKLAQIVLGDGWLTVLLAGVWILVMHYADFRNVRLALASVIPLGVGLLMTLGMLTMLGELLNFMNIVILPILLGFGVSHGLYLLHRFLEGTSPMVAFRSVGAAVASSTLTAIAGFAALFAASHNGLKSMGLVACLGLATTLVVSFTVLASVLQIMHDGRTGTDAPHSDSPGREPERKRKSA